VVRTASGSAQAHWFDGDDLPGALLDAQAPEPPMVDIATTDTYSRETDHPPSGRVIDLASWAAPGTDPASTRRKTGAIDGEHHEKGTRPANLRISGGPPPWIGGLGRATANQPMTTRSRKGNDDEEE
jgi:hypothetical protein